MINYLIFRLTQPDKYQHIIVSFMMMMVFFFFLSIPVSFVLTLVVGMVKEIWDKYYGSGFCWYDMLANFVGILLALVTQMLLISP